MPNDNNTSDLERSSDRLGQRFSNASESDASEDTGNGPAESTQSTNADSSSTEEAEVTEWKPTTVYLPEDTRREFRRFLKRLTLDHPEIEDAEKRQLHTALIRAGMEHPDEVAELAKEEL
ncbi:hypothetical protein MUK72_14360 (plasmid) [Halococcus dombrowskii]|jgi:hypothetical protein|uniref:Uncharacterized protein n=1 Tax=Halococcus dombrowskii TaxID=179637 RepID=A0AAV3SDN6_HALDO|nr:hypothetical protein [Halococcus dombrowskii]UOO96730.1 hypothetical protein MUK72_14360 [Halococcus dombrowskii]